MSKPRQKVFFALAAIAGLTVESLQANPLVPGVAVISEGPARGHSAWDEVNQQSVPMWVDSQTLQTVASAAAAYMGGLRVNAGHFSEITEAAGFLTSFRTDGPKLRADLTLFRSYSQFAHLCELITTIPDTFGLSIDFEGAPEIRDGKAFARCSEIFSCDIVPTPAANEGGLFSADLRGLTPQQIAQLRAVFDNAIASMADPVPPTAPPATPPAAPPATPPPATPPATDNAAITKAVSDALTPALDSALAPLKTEISGFAQRLTAIEASLKADESTDAAVDTSAMPAALKRLRKDLTALQQSTGDQATKLARRFGLEFAARAGANPVENPAGGGEGGGEARKAFEISSSESNLKALQALNLRK